MLSPSLKILATPLSTVYQHFPNEGSKFRSKVAERLPGLCRNIVTQSFLYTFVCFLQNIIFIKTLAKV